jgi:hypothetical protein
MKLDVWFELPEALVNISDNIIAKEDKEQAKMLKCSYLQLNSAIEKFDKVYKSGNFNLNKDENKSLEERIHYIRIELSQILCKTIKFSTNLMKKLLESFEIQKTNKLVDSDRLLSIKMFLKMTRIIIDNAKSCIVETSGSELEFFKM